MCFMGGGLVVGVRRGDLGICGFGDEIFGKMVKNYRFLQR